MPRLKAGELRKDVKVQVTGGLRFAAVTVEAQAIPIKKSGSSFKGSRGQVVLSPDDGIAIAVWFKGGSNAKWELTVTINGADWKRTGNLTGGSVKQTFKANAADFELEALA
jgi:hypothetical protein